MDYSHLRSWYLARLRKNILGKKHARSLTPVAQIRADQLALQELIASSARVTKPRGSPAGSGLSITAFTCCALAVASAVSLLLFFITVSSAAVHSQQAVALLVCGWIPMVVALLASCWYYRRRARKVGEILESLVKGSDSSSVLPKEPLECLDKLARLAELAYQQSIEREYAIADYALDFFFALGSDCLITSASPAAFEFCGYDQTELLGRNFSFLCADVDIPRSRNFFTAMLSAHDAVPFECVWKRKNEQLMDVQISVEYSATENAFFCVARDVTQQKQIERLRKEVVAMVGHDLKTPLTSILCSLDLFEYTSPGLSSESKDTIKLMQSNLNRLLELINDLLDLSKMEAGKLPMQKEQTTVQELFTAARECVDGALIPRGLKLQADASPIVLQVDRKRMTQVLVNLIANAIKYSPDGGEIRLSASCTGSAVLFKVSDRGPGIPPEFKQLIFERFRQLKPSAEAATGGTGLGLAICKHIVESHDGLIGVDSEVGEGSTFWFSLPVLETAANAASGAGTNSSARD